jgi:hypothetical protein
MYASLWRMRQRGLGAIAVLWGGTLLVLHLMRAMRSGGVGAYVVGRGFALAFAALVFGVGLYFVSRPLPPKR